MEILVEILFEVVGQFVLELIADVGFRGVGRVLSNRIVRGVLGVAVVAGAGYGGGYWWGSRLTELGRTDPPRSLWVSIALAAFFTTLALVQGLRGAKGSNKITWKVDPLSALPPWRWSPLRLFSFAALNVAVAVGISVGFDPMDLPRQLG